MENDLKFPFVQDEPIKTRFIIRSKHSPPQLRGEIPDPYQLPPYNPTMHTPSTISRETQLAVQQTFEESYVTKETAPTKPRTTRIAMTATEAEFIYGIVQNHITEKVLTNRATAQDFAPYTDLIKRIKALAER